MTLSPNFVQGNTSLPWKSSRPVNCSTISKQEWKTSTIFRMRSIRECRAQLLRRTNTCFLTSWNPNNPQNRSTHIGKISRRALTVATLALKSSLTESYQKDSINCSSRSKRNTLRFLTGLDRLPEVLLDCSRAHHLWESKRLCLIHSYQLKDSSNWRLIRTRKPSEVEN